MSGPMSDYMNLHRHSIARAELIKRPDLALRLSVAHMICGARNWKIDGVGPRSRKEETRASIEGSKAEAILANERKAVFDLLGLTGDHPQIYHGHYSPHNLCEIFARLITAVDSAEVEAIGLLTKPDFGDYWSPDEAFFDILRDKPTINAMVKEIAGKSCADGAVTDTAKLQKQIIKNRIAGHKSVKGCAPAEAARGLEKLFKAA